MKFLLTLTGQILIALAIITASTAIVVSVWYAVKYH